MQRLSLDSSASKLHGSGGRKEEALTDLASFSSSSSSSSSPSIDYDDHDFKDLKPRRLSLQSPLTPSHSKPEKLIHFIPVLTLLCFIVLYLSSRTPSQSELAQFNGFKRHSTHLDSDSAEIGDVSRFVELPRADGLAIRSLRNLQEIDKFAARSRPRSRYSHRKIADF